MSKKADCLCFLFEKGRENMTRKNRKRKQLNCGEFPNFSGQHLMHNKHLIHEIVNLANVNKNDVVLDLGAGKGALTTVLSQKVGKVFAVEYDPEFVEYLQNKFVQNPNVKIIHQDILKLRLPKEPFVVVSNIPYAITTPIMKMLLNNPSSRFQRGVIVMEKGAAKRFTAKTVKDPYVMAWRMWFDIRYVKDISRKNFSPPPQVDSALITIKRKIKPLVSYNQYLTFWGLVEYVLKNHRLPVDFALEAIFTAPQMKRLKKTLRIKSDHPVGSLSEQQWAIIFETMVKYVPKYRWPKLRKEKLKEIHFYTQYRYKL